MKIEFLILVLFIILIFIFCVGCVSRINTVSDPYIWVDKETGVNYLVYAVGYKGGICPRYDQQGNIFITEVK